METEIEHDTPCTSMAVDSILHAGTAGVIWGLGSGLYNATKSGLRGFPRASFVAKSMAKTGFDLGMFGVGFAIANCGMKKYPRKDKLEKETIEDEHEK